MYIQRHIKSAINKGIAAFPSVLITGPRQVGKSTFLKEEYPNIKNVNLDNRVILESVKSDPLGFLKDNKTPLIIDEIQRASDIFIDIKYFIDDNKRPGMYLLSGSQKMRLMKEISESLAGRIGIFEMLGLSLREIKCESFDDPFFPDEKYLSKRGKNCTEKIILNKKDTDIWEIIHRGSLPELYANELMDWENYYSDYVSTYVERDVRDLSQVGDLRAFVSFMTALAARTGEILNTHAIASDIGVDDKTIKRWLSILEASGIIYILEPLSVNATRRVIKSPKVYFTDTGLVCYLCRWLTPDVLKNGAQSGGIFETFVISEIIKSYYNVGKKPNIYYFRDTNGKEIDLIFFENGLIHPVEIKKTASPNVKDIKHFQTLSKCFPTLNIGSGGIICNYEECISITDNHKIIPVKMI